MRLDSTTGTELRECPLCYDELAASDYPELTLTCGHMSCSDCLREYLKIEIGESRVDISCPECKERLHPADIHSILKDNTACTAKYEEFMIRRVLVTDPDTRWCPAPDCGWVYKISYICGRLMVGVSEWVVGSGQLRVGGWEWVFVNGQLILGSW